MRKFTQVLKATMLFASIAFMGIKQADAQCSMGNSTFSTNFQTNNYILGQSFKADCSGVIDFIGIGSGNYNNAGLRLTIYDGAGDGGTKLYEADYTTLTNATGIRIIPLTTPLAVTAGNTYTFFIDKTTATNFNIRAINNNPYPNGIMYVNFRDNSGSPNLPTYDLLFNVNILSSCQATSSTFTASACNSYTWAAKGNKVYTASNNTDTIHLTNAAGCDSLVTLDLTIISGLPAITGANTVCAGATTTLSNAVAGGVWFTQATSQATINPTTGLVTAKNAGTITVQYSKGACASVTKTLTINPIPSVPSITYAPGTVGNPQAGAPTGSFCVGKTFGVAGTPNSPAGVWSSTGVVGITSGGVVTINSVGSGSIKYTYTNTNGCSNSRTMSGNGVTCAARGVSISNEQLAISNQFTMYPNPAHSLISLNVNMLIGAGSIVVTDLYGKQVKTQTLSMGTNTIDVSKLSKGMYFVSTITSEGKTTKKLVVE